MKADIQVLGDRVIVSIPQGDKKTEAGLYVPEKSKFDNYALGTVNFVGDGQMKRVQLADHTDVFQMIPLRVKKGDVVLYEVPKTSRPYMIGDKSFYIIREEDIVFIMTQVPDEPAKPKEYVIKSGEKYINQESGVISHTPILDSDIKIAKRYTTLEEVIGAIDLLRGFGIECEYQEAPNTGQTNEA